MCAYRARGNGHGQRPYPPRPHDDFYDDRRSRSRSPLPREGSAYRRSPPYDAPRGPSQRYDRDLNRDNRASSPDHVGRSRDRHAYQDRRRSSSPRRGRSTYYDRDRASRSQSRNRSRSRSRSHSRSYDDYDRRPPSRGQPSKEIMLEGLASHLTENDITSELRQHYHVTRLEDVRIIRDRFTKQSRQFGFVTFPTQDDADKFMDSNYPYIYLYGDNNASRKSEDAKVRIAYGKERKEVRAEESDWVCKICNINNYSTRMRCFRCQTLRPDPSSSQKADNVGDNDAAPDNTPSQFLLFRGLEHSTSEDLFAKGVAKLNKPGGLQPQSTSAQPKKGAKVASTTGDANLGAKEGTLRRVLLVRDRRSNESWRYGFAEYASIDDAQAALTRFNSFDRFTIASKQILVSYIHAGVFIPVLNPTPDTERFTFSPLANPTLKLAYWDEDAYVTELVLSAPDTLHTEVGLGESQGAAENSKAGKEVDKTKKRKAQEVVATSSSAKKPAPSHLQFWSNRHAELHGIKSKDEKGSEDSSPAADTTPSRSYADPQRNCCYLCMRQFNSAAEVNKHERLSDLHRRNLKIVQKVERANHKLEKHGVQDHNADTSDIPEYRDRAKERRRVHGVVNKKGETVQHGSAKSANNKIGDDFADGKDTNPPQPSKGAALLSKMGYNPGQGLGASGEGMTAPISQDIYVAGVGLGAEGGKMGDAVKEAERNTRGDYSAFAERTKEGARERYRNLG